MNVLKRRQAGRKDVEGYICGLCSVHVAFFPERGEARAKANPEKRGAREAAAA